jgi:protein-disulfide isomerase
MVAHNGAWLSNEMTATPPPPGAIPFALAGGTWVFVAVIVGLFFVFVFGYYTRSGSGINQTPYRRPDGPPEAPSELAHDTTQNLQNWQRGTEGHHRAHGPQAGASPDPQVAQALATWRSGGGTGRRLDPPLRAADRVRGPADGPTVVVWIDVSNEPCRSAYLLLAEFADAQRIRLAVRQLPLADVHLLSLPAAEALEAAAAQGVFFELLGDFAMSAVNDEHELLERAAGHVPDSARLRAELRTGQHRTSVIEQIHQATASGARAVPAVYIDGSHYDGPIRRDDIGRALRDATARGGGGG